jgi:hypothetical protein
MRTKISGDLELEESGNLMQKQASPRWRSRKSDVRARLEDQRISHPVHGNDAVTLPLYILFLQEPNIWEDWRNALLLIILYMVQGVPLGLSMGSM